MYLVKAGTRRFSLESHGGQWHLNGRPLAADVAADGPARFHLLLEGRSLRAELLEVQPDTKTFTFRINNRIRQVQVLDRFDQLLETMGLSQQAGRRANDLKAPMPGRILEVRAEAGQTVEAGQVLLVLEAMKMENALKAPAAATIAAVQVQAGQVVEKNQVLVRFGEAAEGGPAGL